MCLGGIPDWKGPRNGSIVGLCTQYIRTCRPAGGSVVAMSLGKGGGGGRRDYQVTGSVHLSNSQPGGRRDWPSRAHGMRSHGMRLHIPVFTIIATFTYNLITVDSDIE